MTVNIQKQLECHSLSYCNALTYNQKLHYIARNIKVGETKINLPII